MHKIKAKKILNETKKIYNTIAKEWDVSRFCPRRGLKINLLKKIKRDNAVLDIGCGNGYMIPTVIKKGAIYFGVDNSSKLLDVVKKHFALEIKKGSVKLLCSDALKLRFPKNKFDFIFSFAVLHHLPGEENRRQFFKEIYRVLKKDGSAVITVWNLYNEWPYKRFHIAEQIKNNAADNDEGDFYIPWKATGGSDIKRYIHSFTSDELRSLARAGSFKKIKIDYFDLAGNKKTNGDSLVVFLKR